MSGAAEIVTNKTSELLRWEKRKRREQALLGLLFGAFLIALVTLPLYGPVVGASWRWFVPLVAMLSCTPYFVLRARWRRADSVRVIAGLDKKLRLDERVLTAWDFLERGEKGVAALAVLQQAARHLEGVEPRAFSERTWTWQSYLVLPLALAWASLVWLDVSFQWPRSTARSPTAFAHRLKEFSQDLAERASLEQLPETLRLGRELAQFAQKGVDRSAADEELRAELDALMKRMEAPRASGAAPDSVTARENRRRLADLRAELGAARDLLNRPGGAVTGSQWLDALNALPQLSQRLQEDLPARGAGPADLEQFLQKMQKQVTAELDRRALLDARQVLDQMVRDAPGAAGQSYARVPGAEADPGADEEGAAEKTDSSLPGKELGSKTDVAGPPPEPGAGPATQLKGMPAGGLVTSASIAGKPGHGQSATAERNVLTSYRRQAESDVNNERVPEALKQTIRSYFMSLDQAGAEE